MIPEWLDPSLDGKQRKAARGDPDRVGVKLSAKGWGVDVSTESVLRAGQPLRSDVLEFFLIVLRHVCEVLASEQLAPLQASQLYQCLPTP